VGRGRDGERIRGVRQSEKEKGKRRSVSLLRRRGSIASFSYSFFSADSEKSKGGEERRIKKRSAFDGVLSILLSVRSVEVFVEKKGEK